MEYSILYSSVGWESAFVDMTLRKLKRVRQSGWPACAAMSSNPYTFVAYSWTDMDGSTLQGGVNSRHSYHFLVITASASIHVLKTDVQL